MLLSHTVSSFRAKRHIFATVVMFLISLVFFAAWFSINRSSSTNRWFFFQLGLNGYARSVLTPDEWRGISRFAQQNIQPESHLWGPRKQRQDESESKLWSEFTNRTQIQKLGPFVMVSVHAGPEPEIPMALPSEYTEIEWGGALVGHRGVAIYSSTNNLYLPAGAVSRPMFIAPDIATFLSY